MSVKVSKTTPSLINMKLYKALFGTKCAIVAPSDPEFGSSTVL